MKSMSNNSDYTLVTETVVIEDEAPTLVTAHAVIRDPPKNPERKVEAPSTNGTDKPEPSEETYFFVDSLPPPGVPRGGTWGQQHYRGPLTTVATIGAVLLVSLPGLLVLCFRMDRREIYKAPDGTYYDAKGERISGAKHEIKFVPNPPKILVPAASHPHELA